MANFLFVTLLLIPGMASAQEYRNTVREGNSAVYFDRTLVICGDNTHNPQTHALLKMQNRRNTVVRINRYERTPVNSPSGPYYVLCLGKDQEDQGQTYAEAVEGQRASEENVRWAASYERERNRIRAMTCGCYFPTGYQATVGSRNTPLTVTFSLDPAQGGTSEEVGTPLCVSSVGSYASLVEGHIPYPLTAHNCVEVSGAR